MPAKTWIKVKRGLLDQQHRERLGIRIWLYLHILDSTDWETGKITGWKDGEQAELLQMPHRTLQEQRQRLADDGYISCEQAFQSLTITVHNWTNPREYTGTVYNPSPAHGTESSVGYGEFRTHGTESSVPIQSESSVPLHTVNTINHIKIPHRKERAPSGAPPPPPSAQQLMFQALTDVTLMDGQLNASRIGKAAAALVKAGYTPEQVTALYARGGPWYSRDWRGQRGDPPSPEQIGQTIRAMMEPQYQDAPARTNGHRETTFERNMRALAEIMSEEAER